LITLMIDVRRLCSLKERLATHTIRKTMSSDLSEDVACRTHLM
jgi:hypothetical protein